MSSSSSSSRIESLKIKAKLFQKAKKRAGQPIALKDAFDRIAKTSGFPSWRELRATLEAHELLRPRQASALWSVWYASHTEAAAHLAAHGGYLLPYQKQYFICDDDYVRNLGLDPQDPDVVSVGRDWSKPQSTVAWQRLLGKIARTRLDPKQLVPSSLGQVHAVERITKGMSGASVYSVTTDHGRFVLRIHHGDRSSWRRTLAMYRLASERGVAPLLVHVDDAQQATLSEQIDGMSFGAAVADPATRGAAFGSLTAQLRALQSIEPRGLAASDAMAFARNVYNEQSKRPHFPTWALPFGERLRAIETLLSKDQRQVVCHCDLNPANILWDGKRVWLIDWEGGGLAHPYIDVTSITTFLSIPDEVTIQLLGQLMGEPLDAAEQEKFKAVRDLVRIVYGCVFFRLVPDLREHDFKGREETLPLGECLRRVVAGKLALDSPQGQALVGAAFLAMVP